MWRGELRVVQGDMRAAKTGLPKMMTGDLRLLVLFWGSGCACCCWDKWRRRLSIIVAPAELGFLG